MRIARSIGGASSITTLAGAVGIAVAGCGVGLAGTQSGGDAGGAASPLGGNHDGNGSSSGSGGGSHGGAVGSSGSSDDSGDDQGTADDMGGGDGGGLGSSDAAMNDDGPTGVTPPGSPDGGPACDYSGLWATKITIPVNWVPQGIMSVILAPGSGVIEQWILSRRSLKGLATVDDAQVCGIALPDFSSTGIVGGETYGVRFPDALFDSGDIPRTPISGMLSDTSPSAKFTTDANAVLIGLTLANPTTASWPSTITTAVDTDNDGKPGVTANAASGAIAGATGDAATYKDIPVDPPFGDRADDVYVAIRQVTILSGRASNCDHISGTVTIPKIPNTSTGKYAIDSHVIGCGVAGGGDCSSTETAFVDGTQPVFSPTSGATFTTVRMPGATCATVRQALP
ncbi:MAG TPA: hypothetical protein VHV30_04490 [Polyangiaceae bacterium]|nr:hypothetical protein [Polyangiaceae bacterium]